MAATSNHQRLAAAVAALGGSIDQASLREQVAYNVDAPLGKVWSATFAHTLCVPFGTSDDRVLPTRAAAALLALRDVNDGVVDCDTPHCETCAERAAEVL